MRILLTNDDGVDSPGLHALWRAIQPFGDVAIVAPDRNQTATGRRITIDRPLVVTEVRTPDGATAFATDGTPVDCVRLGLSGLAGPRPDVIVSGANLGVNLGDDITYSGTVAAALEGLLLGVPAIAVSQQIRQRGGSSGEIAPREFDALCRVVAGLLPRVASARFPDHVVLNVNAPRLPPERLKGVRVTRLGRRHYEDRLVDAAPTENGSRSVWVYTDIVEREGEEGTDIQAVADGFVSVTPLHFTLTDIEGMDQLERWEIEDLHLERAG